MHYNKNLVRNLTNCPYCGADTGDYCIGTRGLRKSNHIERVESFRSQRR